MSIASTLRGIFTMGRGLIRGLPALEAGDNPIELFDLWFGAARGAGILLPEAMTLATANRAGVPSARMVLLKSFDRDGFVFFTNYGSRKAAELDDNPHAALLFHWTVLQRQVRVEGGVKKVGEEESFAYFSTRPRGSRIGAWASLQSTTLDSRTTLDARVREMEARYPGEDVPLPPFWGGYRVEPSSIEFWQGRVNRLHDRLRYHRTDEGWAITRLYP
jgi:pyridoxamine 5'-phosphate oxidase